MHSGSACLGPENAADLRDMFAFLKTLPEVEGRARSHDLRILFTIRRGLGLWKLLYLDGQAFAADAAKSPSYGAGLRVAEVAALKVSDVDSERMLLRVERGKGGLYRNAMLSADLLGLLRQWWRVGRQQGVMHRDGWLFPGQHALKPISTRQLHRVVVEAAERERRCGLGYAIDGVDGLRRRALRPLIGTWRVCARGSGFVRGRGHEGGPAPKRYGAGRPMESGTARSTNSA